MMTDELVKRLDDLDPILETEFDTQIAIQRDPYGATKAIEKALYLLRDQAACIEKLTAELSACTESPGGCGYWRERSKALTTERDEALEWLSASQGYIADAVFALDKQEKAEAERDRLREALTDALDAWDTHNKHGDQMSGWWVHDARAALKGEGHE